MKVEIPNHLLVKVSGMISRGIKEAEINEDGILVFTLTDGTKIELGSVKGDQGPRGESGVYVGTGEMPEDCNVQIDPSGEAFEFIQPPKTARIGQALLVKSVDENGKPTEWETGEVTGGTGGTSDHRKLSNRDAADQHPIAAITGLEAAMAGKQPTGNYLTNEALAGAVDDALAQAKASGEFDGADGKTAYQYAQDGGYTGTEAEFSEKLAAEIPAIDNTLSKAGQAADAEKVGEEIRSLSGKIDNIQISGSGMSQTLRAAIYNLLMDAAYQSSDHAADKAALEELLTGESGGGEEVTYYIIEKNLTNVTISNGATSVAAGSAYSATLTADEGYTLDEVTVTMGGETVSVTDGVISIESVTGNIVITATAISEEIATDPFAGTWTEGLRVNGGGKEYPTGHPSYDSTDYVDCSTFDAVTITAIGSENIYINSVNWYDADKTYISHENGYINESSTTYPASMTFLKPEGAAYCRICVTGYENVTITVS